MKEYLQSGRFVDSDHPRVIEFARKHALGADHREKAIALYGAVRDGVRYNPFQNFTLDDSYRGSTCLERGEGWCVPKAALLAACARAVGIPARVGYADVKNHLTTPALTAKMGTDLFVFHGYTDLFLEGKWVKATPAFNLAMCRRFRVKPLEFDGREDSIFHAFDEDNRRHMEYVAFRGAYADVPADEIRRVFAETYPAYFNLGPDARKETFEPA
ncbi:MAG TPA: transglutaminase family protein [Burkholderiales bacterium]|nr:transglutaminase family protein [Burkholderiales bacterium]